MKLTYAETAALLNVMSELVDGYQYSVKDSASVFKAKVIKSGPVDGNKVFTCL